MQVSAAAAVNKGAGGGHPLQSHDGEHGGD